MTTGHRAPSPTAPEEVRSVLLDGTVVRLRPLQPHDLGELELMHSALSRDDRYRRFFGLPSPQALDRFLRGLVDIRDVHVLALGVFLADRLVGVGHFEVLPDAERAEVAFVVEHDLHGRGVATLLLEHLASTARRRGVRRFVAEVLTENTAMLRVFTDSGLTCTTSTDGESVRVELDLDPSEQYCSRMSGRERVADVASLRRLLRPSSLAVVGASRRASAIGNAVLRNIIAGGYDGAIYPINPRAEYVLDLPAFPTIDDLPEPPDLAILCVPADRVPDVAEGCGQRGVRALVVVAAGITDDPELAHQLLAVIRRWGMRLLGPNCIGLVNSEPGVQLDATFSAAGIPVGEVGVVTQSGGVGIALLEGVASLGLGVSTMVSTGDKYDVSGNDMLLWWERDERTKIGVLYLESFGNPRKFAVLARRLSATKPLIVLRGGASPVAQRAAASHTAATATPATVRDALLQQAGVIGVDDLEELRGVLAVLSWQGLPGGRRVAVLTNAGGLGVLAAEACTRAGLEFPTLDHTTRDDLVALLPEQASVRNPVDTTAGVDERTFARSLDILLRDSTVDSVVVPVVNTALTDPISRLASGARHSPKPVLVARGGQQESVIVLRDADTGVPAFAEPGLAARALAEVARYAHWQAQPRGTVPDLPGVDIGAARSLVTKLLHDMPDGGWLEPPAVRELLDDFGFPVVPTTLCRDEAEALATFRTMGGSVAVKAWVEGLHHKSRAGGVVLNISTDAQLRAAWARLHSRFAAALRGVVVQPMVESGREFLVGVTNEPAFGPVIVFGLGGVDTDLIADRSHRLVPLTDRDATDMLHELRASSLLFDADAELSPHADELVDVLLRTARIAELLPEIAEMDLNPVIVSEHGPRIPDARVRLQQRAATDPFIRRLRG